MSRVNTPILSESQRQELEHLYKTSPSHVVRKNCHLILLKAEGRTSKDVGTILGMTDLSVNSWLRRYKTKGVARLSIKPGRGRKPMMTATDTEAVYRHIAKHRQASPSIANVQKSLVQNGKLKQRNRSAEIPFVVF